MSESDAICNELSTGFENPLLATRDFAKHCENRFRNLPISFTETLKEYRARGILRPAYASARTAYYSTFQTWPLWRLLHYDGASAQPDRDFEVLLPLLVKIQDYYLPEIRGDCRTGETRDYGGNVAIGGTYFTKATTMVLSAIRRWRQERIETGDFDPEDVLRNSRLNVDRITRWIQQLWRDAQYVDPLQAWEQILRYISYRRRQKLRYDALLAQDIREMAEMLSLFLLEVGCGAPIISEVLLPGRISGSSASPPSWMLQRFGQHALDNPYEMLEYVANELGINPRPRAVIFTEGYEWRAFKRLFEFFGCDPKQVGIEFRSLRGGGNFSLSNWQCFVEYMHEKQVLIYFAVDREGRTAREARKLLKAKRKFKFAGLKKVIPARDRIVVWRSCFEASNFTNREIAEALARQGLFIGAPIVRCARRQKGSRGLIARLCSSYGKKIDKGQLAEDLADILVQRRAVQIKEPKRRRGVEKWVLRWGEQIVLNHLPTGSRSREANLRSGWLG